MIPQEVHVGQTEFYDNVRKVASLAYLAWDNTRRTPRSLASIPPSCTPPAIPCELCGISERRKKNGLRQEERGLLTSALLGTVVNTLPYGYCSARQIHHLPRFLAGAHHRHRCPSSFLLTSSWRLCICPLTSGAEPADKGLGPLLTGAEPACVNAGRKAASAVSKWILPRRCGCCRILFQIAVD
jgi:hypothetical protein